MFATLCRTTTAMLLAAGVLLAACAPATSTRPIPPAPRASACDDPIYLQLRAADPDSLSHREWARLHELEDLCTAERRAAATGEDAQSAADRGAGMHGARWLWMPATMLFGGLMWLMMGG